MSFLSGLIAKIAQWFIVNLIDKINEYFVQKKLEAERKAVDKKNLEDLINAVKEGKSDGEISKKAEDFLNSTKLD